MRVDVLDHHDRVVDYEADRRGHPAQSHEVEGQADDVHGEKRRQDRDGDDEDGDEGRAPVAQESPEDGDRQQESDQDRVANRRHGGLDQERLVVEGGDLDVSGKLPLRGGELRLDLVGDRDGIGVGLAQDVQQHGGLAVGGDDRVLRLEARPDRTDVRQLDRRVVHGRNHYGVQLVG